MSTHTKTDPAVSLACGRLTAARRWSQSPKAIAEAERDLRAARLAVAISRVQTPCSIPFTREQREQLDALLTGGAR